MLGAIRRVISGEDVAQRPRQEERFPEDVAMPETPREMDLNNNQSPVHDAGGPALVENDHDMEAMDEKLPHMEGDPHSKNISTPGSSLSDMSEARPGEQHEEQDMTGQQQMTIDDDMMHDRSSINPEHAVATSFERLSRRDSRASDSSGSFTRANSQTGSRDWGWFEDVHVSEHLATPYLKRKETTEDKTKQKKGKKGSGLVPHGIEGTPSEGLREIVRSSSLNNEAAAMAVTAPTYVLEESLSSQKLWKDTAGCRPPQPVEERAFFEKMWSQNFARSQVEYRMPVEVLTATSPISLSPFADGIFDSPRGADLSNYTLAPDNGSKNHDVAEATLMHRLHDDEPNQYNQAVINKTVKGTGNDGDLTVLVKGDNVFGTTVSKSFARPSENGGPIAGVDTVNISVASYRVVESKIHGKYAQFLVIYREGSIRDTIGVWKRYSDFQELSKKVTDAHEGCVALVANMSPLAVAEEHEVEHLPNAITSWRLLKKRQRWYRCLDAGYLSLKVFLLERFLHDILFESSNPNLLRDFVGAETSLT